MIQSVNSNSDYWNGQYRNRKPLTVKEAEESNTDSIPEKKTVQSNLSLMDVMGLMRSTGKVKEEEVNRVKDDNISSLDLDGDGYVSTEEYDAFVSELDAENPLSSEEFFALHDTDNDGKISPEEVRYGIEKAQNMPPKPPIKDILPPDIDMDGDGTLSADEYEKLVSLMGTEDTLLSEDFFNQYDTNEDGELSAEEARTALEATAGQRSGAKAYENNYRYVDDNSVLDNII